MLDTRAFLGQMVKHFLETPPILIDNYSQAHQAKASDQDHV